MGQRRRFYAISLLLSVAGCGGLVEEDAEGVGSSSTSSVDLRRAAAQPSRWGHDEHRTPYVWDAASATSSVYDTSLAGHSNTGHDTPEFNGIDWKRQPNKLRDLLEYLKTL